MTRTAYDRWTYRCLACGYHPKGYEARVPAGQDAAKCGPVSCGRCNGTRFEPELVEGKKCA